MQATNRRYGRAGPEIRTEAHRIRRQNGILRRESLIDTDYDRAKVPLHNSHDHRPPLEV